MMIVISLTELLTCLLLAALLPGISYIIYDYCLQNHHDSRTNNSKF